MVKNLPAMQVTCVWSLGWKDPLEEGMATRSTILVWRILMDREAWWATMGSQSQTLQKHLEKNRFIVLQFYRSEVQHEFPWAKTEVSGSLRKNLPFPACRDHLHSLSYISSSILNNSRSSLFQIAYLWLSFLPVSLLLLRTQGLHVIRLGPSR